MMKLAKNGISNTYTGEQYLMESTRILGIAFITVGKRNPRQGIK